VEIVRRVLAIETIEEIPLWNDYPSLAARALEFVIISWIERRLGRCLLFVRLRFLVFVGAGALVFLAQEVYCLPFFRA
jgi:hypothetical protein